VCTGEEVRGDRQCPGQEVRRCGTPAVGETRLHRSAEVQRVEKKGGSTTALAFCCRNLPQENLYLLSLQNVRRDQGKYVKTNLLLTGHC
jgi:hypothetical protein